MSRAGPAAVVIALGVVALALGSCGTGDDVGNPDSELTVAEARAPLATEAPAPLRSLREDANLLLDGGIEDFEQRLQTLRGLPVVINVWASWCGPCRHEFPFFQSQAIEHGEEIGFVGVDVADNDDAARTFLDELPLPYPSYIDPGTGVGDAEIAKSLDVGPGLPNTIFLDASGEVVYHWRGSYADEEKLAEQIERYALG